VRTQGDARAARRNAAAAGGAASGLALARTARRGAGQSGGTGDGLHGAAHGHALRVRVCRGAARQSRRAAGQRSGARQGKTEKREKEGGKRKKKGGKREEREKKEGKEKKRNGREKKERRKRERERRGACRRRSRRRLRPVGHARALFALREEKGVASALNAESGHARSSDHRAVRDRGQARVLTASGFKPKHPSTRFNLANFQGVTREEEPAGSVERRAGELGDRWRRKSGEGAAGSWGKCWRWVVGGAAEKQRGEAGGRR
jgi:hypothetical protein